MRRLSIFVVISLCAVGATPAFAQTCPADLTGLNSQIQTDRIRPALAKTFDALVQEAGGLAPAIAAAESDVTKYQTRLANLPADVSAFERQLTEDAVLIAQARVTALRCREED